MSNIELTRKDYEKVFEDYNEYLYAETELSHSEKKFLSHKFPETDYVGKVWENDGWIGYVTSVDKSGGLYGYGFSSNGEWINRKKGLFLLFRPNELKNLTQATEEEWKEALVKEAKRRWFVEGAIIKKSLCRIVFGKEKIEGQHHNSFNSGKLNEFWLDSDEGGACVMKDGIWAEVVEDEKQSTRRTSIELGSKPFNEITVNGVTYVRK